MMAVCYAGSAAVNCEECVFIVGTHLNFAKFSKHLLCGPPLRTTRFLPQNNFPSLPPSTNSSTCRSYICSQAAAVR